MAWNWSHSSEAIQDAYDQVHCLSRKTLLTIIREWQYDSMEKAGKKPSFRLPIGVSKLAKDMLADSVCERMQELALCTNGGFEAYCCPDGCHTVPFSPSSV